ncbi:unnamed protein product [Schistosoma rodhaini]|uniref:Ftz-F1 interacting protein n=1 Tax=Schistosoma rodhaini TaxID=6188 RepID=A0AA85FXK1_9TREM|nr:unnamed protein product [Schistosoma rodhaini]
MPSKRNDIRISRKFVPNPGSLKTTKKDRYIRPISSAKSKNIDSDQILTTDKVPVAKDNRNSERKTSRNSAASNLGSSLKSRVMSDPKRKPTDTSDSRLTLSEQKRKRSGAENYINKRFLYDVVEPPKRNRQKKFLHFTDRSTAALMAVSSANLLKKHKSKHSVSSQIPRDRDLYPHVKSRHGRRLKPKHEYSPSQSADEHPSFDQPLSTDSSWKPIRKNKALSQATKSRLEHKSDTTNYNKHDDYKKDYYSSDEDQGGSELGGILSSKTYYPDASCISTYSEIFSELQKPEQLIHSRNPDTMENHGRSGSSRIKNRSNLRRVLSPSCNQKEPTNSFLRQTVFRSDEISPPIDRHTTNILDFCISSSVDQFPHLRTSLDKTAIHEDDLESVESRGLVNRRVQQSQEELEEDLLAPELSIITGSNTATSSDGVLVSTLTDTGAMLSCNSSSGSSRRKSPVRPMQVLRTKTTHTSTTAAPSNASPTMLVTGSDNSPFVFTSPSVVTNTVYSRSLSDLDIGHDGDVLTTGICSVLSGNNSQSLGESNQSLENTYVVNNSELEIHSISDHSHQILSSGSSLALTSISSVNQVPVCIDSPNVSKGNTTVSSGLLPSLLTQSTTRPVSVVQQPIISRVFMAPNTTRSITTPVTKPVMSVPHSTLTSVSSRRRPTILKRTLGTVNSTTSNSLVTSRPTVFETSDNDVDLSTSSSRNISVFSPGSTGQLQKPVSSLTTEESGPSVNLTNTSTKLLQLVTSTTTSTSDRLNLNQTASDRLFGKRLIAHNRNASHTPNNAVSNTTQNSGTTHHQSPAPTNTTINTATPYRYAVVRGSADGKQYVLISNPRMVDQTVHEQPVVTLTTTVNDAPLEPIYVSTPVGENFNSQQIFSVDSGVSRAFKVEINGAHLIRMNPEGHSISGNDRQIRTIYTTPQSATTLAAT